VVFSRFLNCCGIRRMRSVYMALVLSCRVRQFDNYLIVQNCLRLILEDCSQGVQTIVLIVSVGRKKHTIRVCSQMISKNSDSIHPPSRLSHTLLNVWSSFVTCRARSLALVCDGKSPNSVKPTKVFSRVLCRFFYFTDRGIVSSLICLP
jgi:hypothetical protein